MVGYVLSSSSTDVVYIFGEITFTFQNVLHRFCVDLQMVQSADLT